ncbi:MAG: hypothetical protein ABSG63_08445, partial [Spirochaetia bacterium]
MSFPSQRLEVFTRATYPDGRARRALASARRALSAAIREIAIVDVFLLDGLPSLDPAVAAEVFCDAVAQELLLNAPAAAGPAYGAWDHLVEITVKPGVTDPVALTAREALHLCLPGGVPDTAIIQTAVQYLVSVDPGAAVDPTELARFFHNPLIQSAFSLTRASWEAGGGAPPPHKKTPPGAPPPRGEGRHNPPQRRGVGGGRDGLGRP